MLKFLKLLKNIKNEQNLNFFKNLSNEAQKIMSTQDEKAEKNVKPHNKWGNGSENTTLNGAANHIISNDSDDDFNSGYNSP